MAKPFKKKTWTVWICVYFAIDVLQALIDLGLTEAFFAPEITNEILDFFIEASQIGLFWYGGALNLKTAGTSLITLVLEEGTAGGAPFWFIDVWYASRKAPKAEDIQAATVSARPVRPNNINEDGDLATELTLKHGVGNAPLNLNGIRLPDSASLRPLNVKSDGKGIRPPSAA